MNVLSHVMGEGPGPVQVVQAARAVPRRAADPSDREQGVARPVRIHPAGDFRGPDGGLPGASLSPASWARATSARA